jgi:dATP pyrophosphohydrolase
VALDGVLDAAKRLGMTPDYKIPLSVLVVTHTPALRVLLIERSDVSGFGQLVTGSKDHLDESFVAVAVHEVPEETGIDARPGQPLFAALCDWHMENVYDIYPQWRHRYAPELARNTEHLLSLCVPKDTAVRLNPHEHTARLPCQEAAQACFSPSNAAAILALPQRYRPS